MRDGSRDQLLRDVSVGVPHVVLLGAGASRAAFPDGDAYGQKLPLMNDLMETLDLYPYFKNEDLERLPANFETLYSRLVDEPEMKNTLDSIELAIKEYFEGLRLPDQPTLYDHLLLSLRPKDLILTFNWDPLLIQAHKRNRARAHLPDIRFLHGNVAVTHCPDHDVLGNWRERCPKCEQPLKPMPLLFPIEKKDYAANSSIRREWEEGLRVIRNACLFTVFGYSAPRSDVEAMSLIKASWESNKLQQNGQNHIEIIDIAPTEQIIANWDGLIFRHHVLIVDNFYDSFAAKWPRRSGEAKRNASLLGRPTECDPIPRDASFDDLDEWVRERVRFE